MGSIHYDIFINEAKDHLLEVCARISAPQENQQFSLPSWIPGSYLIREFSKEIVKISAQQNGKVKKLVQLDKNTWTCNSSTDSELTLRYWIYARDASVRTAWLDLDRGFFNGSSVFMNFENFHDHIHQVTIHPPQFNPQWKLATGLKALKVAKNGFGLYEAQNYAELIDCPVEMGMFWSGEFTACGIVHRVVVSGAPITFDGKRLVEDVQKICEYQIQFWHGKSQPVIKNYLFILCAVADGYGGLEHKNSTALIANRSDLPRLGDTKASEGYIQLLGLFSHEYFHTWNIKRLRPKEFQHLDLKRENYTELLWFFEGFTSYYDDLVLVRCGLIGVNDYLKLLTKTINQVLQTPGRKVHTVAQSSFEAWTKYYRPQPNTANITVSYYTKGALIALCLDLTLRLMPPENISGIKKRALPKTPTPVLCLDDLMKHLWSTCKGGLMSEDDLLSCLKDLTGMDFKKKLQDWVHSTKELPLSPLLNDIGVSIKHEPAQWAQKLGLRVLESQTAGIVIKQVLNDSISQKAGLCDGDEWIGVEVLSKKSDAHHLSWRIHKLEDIALYVGDHRYIHALICRDKRILSIKMDLKELQSVKTLRLTPTDSDLLKSWLLP